MNCRLDKNKVLSQFNKAADSYDSVAMMQRTIVDVLLRLMPAKMPSNSKLVDLGCGTGYALAQLAQQYPKLSLFGADIAPNMVKIARQRIARAHFCIADIEDLPYRDHFFDTTFSSSAIQWCNLAQIITEIKRITRPCGHIYLSSFTRGTLLNWRTLWMDQQSQRQQDFVSCEQIKQTLVDLEFTDIKIEQQTLYQHFHHFNDAVNSIKQLGAGNATRSKHTGLMSKGKYLAIKEKVNGIIQEQGQLTLPYEVVYLSAKRAER